MPTSPDGLYFATAALTIPKGQTPHYLRHYGYHTPTLCEDFSYADDEVGVLVGDGLGAGDGGDVPARVVVEAIVARSVQLRLREMPIDESVQAMHEDILPYADLMLGREKDRLGLETASTALGGVMLGRRHVLAVSAGDVPTFFNGTRYPNGKPEEKFFQLTQEQGEGNGVFNTFAGRGRTAKYGESLDHVVAVPVMPGDRFLTPDDGLLGDTHQERLPQEYGGHNLLQYNLKQSDNPRDIVNSLSRLPLRLEEEGVKVPVKQFGSEGMFFYEAKDDDFSVGAMIVWAR